MNSIIAPRQVMQPRIVSLAELKAKLLPLCVGYVWAEGAITDLWMKGAPVPQGPGQPERRVLIPAYFASWWNDVQQRMGFAPSAEQVYGQVSKKMRTSAGQFTRR